MSSGCRCRTEKSVTTGAGPPAPRPGLVGAGRGQVRGGLRRRGRPAPREVVPRPSGRTGLGRARGFANRAIAVTAGREVGRARRWSAGAPVAGAGLSGTAPRATGSPSGAVRMADSPGATASIPGSGPGCPPSPGRGGPGGREGHPRCGGWTAAGRRSGRAGDACGWRSRPPVVTGRHSVRPGTGAASPRRVRDSPVGWEFSFAWRLPGLRCSRFGRRNGDGGGRRNGVGLGRARRAVRG